MKKNKFLAWLRRPHGIGLVVVYLLTVAACVASVVLVVAGESTASDVLSYVLFGVAAILLGYAVYTIVIYAPKIRQKGKELIKRNRFGAAISENYGLKTAVFGLFSFAVTLAFTVMNTVSAVRYRSVWYGALAGYYAVLMCLRGGVIAAGGKSVTKSGGEETGLREWYVYLIGGACLLVLEIAMVAAVTQLMLSERPAKSGQVMAIANAAYTFFKVGMSVYNLAKAHKFRNPVTQALRNFGFADACMSVVSLTVLMLSTFGEGEGETGVLLYLKSIIGFVACAAIIALSSVMIVRADKKIKKIKSENQDERGEI